MVALVNPTIAGTPQGTYITIASVSGTVASPITTLTGTTASAFTLPIVPTIPPGMLQNGSRLRVQCYVQRTGANGTANLDAFLGTSGTTSDSRLDRSTSAATTLQVCFIETAALIGSSFTTALSIGKVAYNTWGVDNQFGDVSTNINTAATMKVTFAISGANASDSFALLHYRVWIEN